ncbi:ureidoacrylate peracid hydrolase [Amycolatopsis bartoniae]|uniref:Hydrolase n=1 Tax=Amycolatopsis bartoniae TaxID=941986 RepID=A0A8H9IU07_9PSEU|nr:isochorismatase family cysteine hydrolase [Amycolatopsis bartoniae]MBB2936961.1 ureidoacrylate peracid hydrolase [Amycolatopsis bartoniae]TVT06454.1 cysteine hydrolase [Amycolatopsis bartoniae]GHF51498.1 hydrolase [Amycolatopsis bartoniae]
MTPWHLDPESCALLVIDMQNDFVREGFPMEVPMARSRLPAIRTLVHACRARRVPVVYTQQILYDSFDVSPLETAYQPKLREVGMRDGTYGAEIVDELRPEPCDHVVRKHRYDAFHNTPLQSVLATVRGLNVVDTLIITGTLTEVCCESTARSAFMRDYKVAFVSDATGALSEAAQEATLHTMRSFFGRVMTTAEVLEALR